MLLISSVSAHESSMGPNATLHSMARDEGTNVSYCMSPSFARERKSWRDKRCPLNGRYNGLTITEGRAQNNGEIFSRT
jgi:hypothetical protein